MKPTARALLAAAIFLGAVSAAALWTLAAVQFSTSDIVAGTPAEADARPTPDFHIGTVTWPVRRYAADPALKAFRDEFSAHCNGLRGIAAGVCVSNALVGVVTPGLPTRGEYFDSIFDPSRTLAAHLSGAAGVCVSLSWIISSELLSVGIPARDLVVLPLSDQGHNILELWDDARGWALFDPSLGSLIGDDSGPKGSVAALAAPRTMRLLGGGISPRGPDDGLIGLYESKDVPLFGGDVLYPEPWLSLRTGERLASWPFRARFARVGVGQWRAGPAQAALRWTTMLAGLAAVLLLFAAGRRWRAGTRARVTVAAAAAAAPAEAIPTDAH